jgi:hypothetical protein
MAGRRYLKLVNLHVFLAGLAENRILHRPEILFRTEFHGDMTVHGSI